MDLAKAESRTHSNKEHHIPLVMGLVLAVTYLGVVLLRLRRRRVGADETLGERRHHRSAERHRYACRRVCGRQPALYIVENTRSTHTCKSKSLVCLLLDRRRGFQQVLLPNLFQKCTQLDHVFRINLVSFPVAQYRGFLFARPTFTCTGIVTSFWLMDSEVFGLYPLHAEAPLCTKLLNETQIRDLNQVSFVSSKYRNHALNEGIFTHEGRKNFSHFFGPWRSTRSQQHKRPFSNMGFVSIPASFPGVLHKIFSNTIYFFSCREHFCTSCTSAKIRGEN